MKIKIIIIIISIILMTIIYYQPIKYNNLLRKFNVLSIWDKTILNNIINHKYLLWDNNNTKNIPQFFTNYDTKLYKTVPNIINKNSIIYIPETFKVKYPMYFETIEDNDKKYYYPTRNSIIISKKDLKWIGNKEDNQIVIGAIKKLNKI